MIEIELCGTKCKRCIYSMKENGAGNGSKVVCNYICITGHRRGCKISECDKFVDGRRKRANTDVWGKEERR